MPKIRGFKADLWTDEDFVELTPYARLLWMGMWNYCCDNGHIQDKSKQIKMRVLPTDNVNCAELLREIEAQGLIEREDGWITVPNLTHHQSPHKRWWVKCEKPGCEFPNGATYGYSKPDSTVEQPLVDGETTVNNGGSTADVDVEVMLKGSDGDTSATGTSPGKPPKKASKTTAHSFPSDFEPNETNRRLAAERGLVVEALVDQWADHHIAKGSKFVDWHRSLNTWIRRERPAQGNVAPLHTDSHGRQILPPPPSRSPWGN